MNVYNFHDYFTPEAIALIGKSEIIGIDGVTPHAVVLLSCDMVPYAVIREEEGLIHAGSLLSSLPCPAFALSDGLYGLDVDGILDGLSLSLMLIFRTLLLKSTMDYTFSRKATDYTKLILEQGHLIHES